MYRNILILLLLSAMQLLFAQQKKFNLSDVPVQQDGKQQINEQKKPVKTSSGYEEYGYINHYASGSYSRWEAEENIELSSETTGIKHEFGIRGDSYWRSGMSEPPGRLLITGPDYIQQKDYQLYYNNCVIIYEIKFFMKIDGEPAPGVPVCEIFFTYRLSNGSDSSWGHKTIFADMLSNNFSAVTLNYCLPSSIRGIPLEKDDKANGIQFNVRWLGNRDLYVDYIEVYDHAIWSLFLYYPEQTSSQLVDFMIMKSKENGHNRYILNKPISLDNYEPYRVVDSILTSNGYQRQISSFLKPKVEQPNN